MVLATYQIDVNMSNFRNCLRYREGDFNPVDMEAVLTKIAPRFKHNKPDKDVQEFNRNAFRNLGIPISNISYGTSDKTSDSNLGKRKLPPE